MGRKNKALCLPEMQTRPFGMEQPRFPSRGTGTKQRSIFLLGADALALERVGVAPSGRHAERTRVKLLFPAGSRAGTAPLAVAFGDVRCGFCSPAAPSKRCRNGATAAGRVNRAVPLPQGRTRWTEGVLSSDAAQSKQISPTKIGTCQASAGL